MRVYIPPRR